MSPDYTTGKECLSTQDWNETDVHFYLNTLSVKTDPLKENGLYSDLYRRTNPHSITQLHAL